MNQILLQRRETLIKNMAHGLGLKATAEEMTKDITDPNEREKQIKAIRQDWHRRSRWMEDVLRVKHPTFLAELVSGMNEAMKRCWVEALQPKGNANSRVAALRTIIMGKTRVALLLMKAGVIEVVPEKIDQTILLPGTPFDLDPQMKQAILDEAKRQLGEKQNATPGKANSG